MTLDFHCPASLSVKSLALGPGNLCADTRGCSEVPLKPPPSQAEQVLSPRPLLIGHVLRVPVCAGELCWTPSNLPASFGTGEPKLDVLFNCALMRTSERRGGITVLDLLADGNNAECCLLREKHNVSSLKLLRFLFKTGVSWPWFSHVIWVK